MENIVERNNTSFPKQLFEAMKSIKADTKDPLRYHQRLVNEYLLKYPMARGLLAYHKMGAGKSILGISICEALLEKEHDMRVLFIASKSLHMNMKNTIIKYREMNGKTGDDLSKYDFISLNASNMITQVYNAVRQDITEETEKIFDNQKNKNSEEETIEFLDKMKTYGNLNNTIVMIDEAHNFFNSITNNSKNAIGLYRLIMEAKNIKVLFLTGSPIVNDPFEIAVAYNMLAGPIEQPPKKSLTLFGEDYEDFDSYFVTETGIKNKNKFMHRIVGLTSYFGADSKEDMKLYPEQKPTTVRKVPMSIKQYTYYIEARDREIEESSRPQKHKKTGKTPLSKPEGRSSSYRVRSRQFSNIVYPEYASHTYRDANNVPRYTKSIEKLKDESLSGKELQIYSPKIYQLLIDLQRHVAHQFLNLSKSELKENAKQFPPPPKCATGPGIIYSQFKDSGVDLLARILTTHGFQQLILDQNKKTEKPSDEIVGGKKEQNEKGAKRPYYCVISGDVDIEERQKMIDVFNSEDNMEGELLAVLLVTSTGAEGLDLKNGRFVMVLEPYWHWSRIAQIFARVVRMMSHMALPQAERYVQPYVYLSDYPTTSSFEGVKDADEKEAAKDFVKKQNREPTTDVQLYTDAIKNQIIINKFRLAMEEASIDCHMHNKDKSHCVMCAPTNRQLFISNLDMDIRAPSRCEPLVEEKIKAKSIMFNDVEYKYTKTDGKLHIFEYVKNLDAYREIEPNHPDYFALHDELN